MLSNINSVLASLQNDISSVKKTLSGNNVFYFSKTLKLMKRLYLNLIVH